MRFSTVCCSILLAANGGLIHVEAQQPSSATREVSGATNPELIPDDQALGSLFSRVGDGKGAPPWESRIAFLRDSGLNDSKCEIVVNSANRYLSAFKAAQLRMDMARREKQSPAAKQLLFSKDSQDLNRLWREVTESMATELGKEDYDKLKSFVDRKIKPNLTLVVPQ